VIATSAKAPNVVERGENLSIRSAVVIGTLTFRRRAPVYLGFGELKRSSVSNKPKTKASAGQ